MRRVIVSSAALLVLGLLVWQGFTTAGNPDPTAPHISWGVTVIDIGVLVFREGLECILVLAAITASMVGDARTFRRPIAAGVAIAFAATLITWRIAIGVIDSLTGSFSALQIQAVTGLIAILVLLVVMNWFFHKVYWTGWISVHTRRKRVLLDRAREPESARRVLLGLGMLGFTSLYREGFEVVLFLQNYRLKLGGAPVFYGVLVGLFFTGIVAILTFVANQKLPHRKMLVLTGVLLGGVLLVMVGEQAQEMQLAHWLPTTPARSLSRVIRPWMGVWLSVFPTVETLTAQMIAALLVIGSYTYVRGRIARDSRRQAPA